LSGARCHWLYVISYVRAMFGALTDGAAGFKTGLVRDRCGQQGSKKRAGVRFSGFCHLQSSMEPCMEHIGVFRGSSAMGCESAARLLPSTSARSAVGMGTPWVWV